MQLLLEGSCVKAPSIRTTTLDTVSECLQITNPQGCPAQCYILSRAATKCHVHVSFWNIWLNWFLASSASARWQADNNYGKRQESCSSLPGNLCL
ncbi:hypothetical protein GUJ93_ZPchr0010g8587 [Zizania palustris]|uniref:Uncharacterized protein n=1 Tax=Zizania palustris TaxID=103762 RepID=A0A8J5WEI2_ZIZPA|nr:hypothetical protein GUJ93_ZPchr0010g8587 [Zizania palustris]